MKNNKPIKDPVVGMRVKLSLPTRWCQVQSNSPYIWFKARIIEVNENSIILANLKSKKCCGIDRLMCFKENGVYKKIIKQK